MEILLLKALLLICSLFIGGWSLYVVYKVFSELKQVNSITEDEYLVFKLQTRIESGYSLPSDKKGFKKIIVASSMSLFSILFSIQIVIVWGFIRLCN